LESLSDESKKNGVAMGIEINQSKKKKKVRETLDKRKQNKSCGIRTAVGV
jgi:hypothetical protein